MFSRPYHQGDEVKSRPKRRRAKFIELFFSKTIIFKDMKATSYKIKNEKD